MKKLKLQLSGFDIGMIIAFVVVTLIGAGGWYYLSGMLTEAQTQDTAVKKDFDDYSVKSGIIVNGSNIKNLQDNSVVLKEKVDPIIGTYLLSGDNKLRTVDREDPVAWKHDLDDDVHTLNSQAKTRIVSVPNNYYFGFSRYLTQSPGDEQTAVLTKQRLGLTEIANILIKEQVKTVLAMQRTYEEDVRPGTTPTPSLHVEPDQLAGYAVAAPGNVYTAYPFQIEFEASPESIRPVLDDLIKSPYLFVVRTVEVHNSNPNSPLTSSLADLAGPPSTVNLTENPGGASSAPTKGPQKLFGYATLNVKIRLDLIEWNPAVKDTAPKNTRDEEVHRTDHPDRRAALARPRRGVACLLFPVGIGYHRHQAGAGLGQERNSPQGRCHRGGSLVSGHRPFSGSIPRATFVSSRRTSIYSIPWPIRMVTISRKLMI